MAVKVKGKNNQEGNGLDKLLSLIRGADLAMEDIIPYKQITKEGFLVDRDNHYQAILKVKTADLFSMNTDELERRIGALTNLTRVYTEPFKVFSTTYPTETRQQQEYHNLKINQYRKRLVSDDLTERQRDTLEQQRFTALENLNRLKFAEDKIVERAFFIVVYGKTPEEIKERVRSMQRVGKRYFGFVHVTNRRTLIAIIRRLTNMNSEM